MPRGGRREGSGRKSQWASGCSFSETTLIRIPKVIRDRVLEIAHRLDAGEKIELVTVSIKERNQYLEQKVAELEKQLLETKKQSSQLQLPIDVNSDFWNGFRNSILKSLRMGSQSKTYQRVKQAINKEIARMNL